MGCGCARYNQNSRSTYFLISLSSQLEILLLVFCLINIYKYKKKNCHSFILKCCEKSTFSINIILLYILSKSCCCSCWNIYSFYFPSIKKKKKKTESNKEETIWYELINMLVVYYIYFVTKNLAKWTFQLPNLSITHKICIFFVVLIPYNWAYEDLYFVIVFKYRRQFFFCFQLLYLPKSERMCIHNSSFKPGFSGAIRF